MWTVLYMAFFMWLESLFVVNEGYRNAVLCGTVILTALVWMKWKKCFLWLNVGRYILISTNRTFLYLPN